MSYIYLTSKNLSCSFSSNQLIIKKDNQIIDAEPIETVEGIVLKESSLISSKSICQLLKRQVPITYIDYNYRLLGTILNEKISIQKQVKQFKCKANESFCLDFSKKIIKSKLKNQSVIVKRLNKLNSDEINKSIANLNKYIQQIDLCTSINEILGFEGICAKEYFGAIASLIDEDFKFEKRTKRPPKDPFNSLISYGYSILYNEIILALSQLGLNPHAGFMHQDKDGHAALASDLLEQWRSPIIDSLVLKLLSRKSIKLSDFTINSETGACYLSRKANAVFLNAYEEKMRSKNDYFKSPHGNMSFRNSIIYNINRLTDSLDTESLNDFKTFTLR